MVDFTTGDTPLELARKAKEEETRQLMGFGETRESRQEMTEMQEIQNIFNTYKRTGSTLLQEGKITSEQYYNNTRRAGIKLGVTNMAQAHIRNRWSCHRWNNTLHRWTRRIRSQGSSRVYRIRFRGCIRYIFIWNYTRYSCA